MDCVVSTESLRMDWACGANGEKRKVYGLFVERSEGKKPLGRPRRRWADNIKMDLVEI
jgi:hypothetical protein